MSSRGRIRGVAALLRGSEPGGDMQQPKRIWWARPRKLCALERPGGGGRSHRPERREDEIGYLLERGGWLVVSTMGARHKPDAHEEHRLEWHPLPGPSGAEGGAARPEP